MEGIVKFFYRKKGWGYITGEDSIDYFVHHSGILSDEAVKCLLNNSAVTFDIMRQVGKPCDKAINVIENRTRTTDTKEVNHGSEKILPV